MHRSLDGINVALVTPFDEREHVAEEALAALVEDQISHGVHGLVVNGSTGEFTSLTPEERKRNVIVTTDAAGGRVPIIVQVGAMTTREAVAHAEHAGAQGAVCVMLVCPWYEPLNDREIEEYVRAVAAVGLPVMLYNNPAATGWSMSPELIARLAERIDGFQYLKDTTGDAGRLCRAVAADRAEPRHRGRAQALGGLLPGQPLLRGGGLRGRG